ncbi:TIGR03364 family FAD-dependent oxidoreductase [Brevibacterium album]|uniref:TIGR03364 family FAD-dependent oxidoreductase n=1 Tax=Brevibacterium album TaxID=417948 RepID=UPI00041AA36C|nr:TIGR03364 family FAD-dependent oxidoreductase [Brevibacterium album]
MQNSPHSTAHSDIAVVGSGIVGLAHARAALRRGLTVTVIEADHEPVGASVRNFGHCCITGQTGIAAELAEAGREHWLSAASAAGFWARESGAYVAASSGAEMRVLKEAQRAQGAERIRLLDAAEIAAALGTAETGTSAAGTGATTAVGGAHLPRDLRVDPRTAAPALAAWLRAQPGVAVLTGTRALEIAPGGVLTTRGFVSADHTFACTGHHLQGLLPELAERAGVRECALNMALVDAPAHLTTDAAVLTGTSLLRYDAFSTTAAAGPLRAHLAETEPALLGIGANVMFARRPDGSLLVGDSHAYAPTVGPFLDEDATEVLLTAAARILGTPSLRVRQRWQGVYASSETRPLVIEPLGSHATAVTVATGIGMTLAFGLAEHTLTGLEAETGVAALAP